MFQLTEYEGKKLNDMIDSYMDINKCDEYYYKINNGNHSCIYEALSFANDKYDELCITDPDIVSASQIISGPGTINHDLVESTLSNLQNIRDLLLAKICKDLLSK